MGFLAGFSFEGVFWGGFFLKGSDDWMKELGKMRKLERKITCRSRDPLLLRAF